MASFPRRARAFTLLEVMIVIAIILALGGLVGIALFQRREEAKTGLAQSDMNTIKSSINWFYSDFDRVPTTEEGVVVLWDKAQLDDPEQEPKWKGYMQKPLEKDRWDHEWGYEQVSRTSYKLWSVGPDGEEGSDDDISVTESVLPGGTSEDEGGVTEDLLPPDTGGGGGN